MSDQVEGLYGIELFSVSGQVVCGDALRIRSGGSGCLAMLSLYANARWLPFDCVRRHHWNQPRLLWRALVSAVAGIVLGSKEFARQAGTLRLGIESAIDRDLV